MAYSDYGGYAYRNGTRVEDRSDCTITPEGDTFGTPGMWPGFASILLNKPEMRDWPSGHAVLGDGPIYVVLYKQTATCIYRAFELLDLVDCLDAGQEACLRGSVQDGKDTRYIDVDYWDERGPCVFHIDGCCIEVHWEQEDNYYQYARLTQPDGTVWTGFAGYGVGAGLEDAGYGYSTEDREDRLKELFPDAFAEHDAPSAEE